MTSPRQLIKGKPALIDIDIRASTFIDDSVERSIPNMPDYRGRMEAAQELVDVAHETDVPVIFMREIQRADGHQWDYFCRVAEDCVGGSSIGAHDASLKAMEYLKTGAMRPKADIIQSTRARQS